MPDISAIAGFGSIFLQAPGSNPKRAVLKDTLNMQLLADCRGAEGRNMHLEEPTGCRALVCVEHDGLPQPGLYKSKSSR